jgi:hypothetical protein
MAVPTASQASNPDDEKEADQSPTQESRKALGLSRKIGELAAELQETVRLGSEGRRKSDIRERAILNRETGGGIERILRRNLKDSDRAFMISRGWRL